jgi:hypothetical protein
LWVGIANCGGWAFVWGVGVVGCSEVFFSCVWVGLCGVCSLIAFREQLVFEEIQSRIECTAICAAIDFEIRV